MYEEITLFIDLSKERVSTMGIVLPTVLTLRIFSIGERDISLRELHVYT